MLAMLARVLQVWRADPRRRAAAAACERAVRGRSSLQPGVRDDLLPLNTHAVIRPRLVVVARATLLPESKAPLPAAHIAQRLGRFVNQTRGARIVGAAPVLRRELEQHGRARPQLLCGSQGKPRLAHAVLGRDFARGSTPGAPAPHSPAATAVASLTSDASANGWRRSDRSPARLTMLTPGLVRASPFVERFVERNGGEQ